MKKIKAVIFDWAGTTVDFGCMAPVQAFVEVFKQFGIEPTMEEVREPMGMLKIDHIRTMLTQRSTVRSGQRSTVKSRERKKRRRCIRFSRRSF